MPLVFVSTERGEGEGRGGGRREGEVDGVEGLVFFLPFSRFQLLPFTPSLFSHQYLCLNRGRDYGRMLSCAAQSLSMLYTRTQITFLDVQLVYMSLWWNRIGGIALVAGLFV